MLKKLVLILALLVGVATSAQAQTPPFRAFIVRPSSQEALAKAIEKNDRKLLNMDCRDLVNATNLGGYAQQQLESCADLAKYVRTLALIDCPPVGRPVKFGRVDAKGVIDMTTGVLRQVHTSEKCLVDNYSGKIVLSLFCGNFLIDEMYGVEVTAPAPPAEPATQVAQPAPAPAPVAEAPPAPEPAFVPEPSNRAWYDPHRKSSWITAGVVTLGAIAVAHYWPATQIDIYTRNRAQAGMVLASWGR